MPPPHAPAAASISRSSLALMLRSVSDMADTARRSWRRGGGWHAWERGGTGQAAGGCKCKFPRPQPSLPFPTPHLVLLDLSVQLRLEPPHACQLSRLGRRLGALAHLWGEGAAWAVGCAVLGRRCGPANMRCAAPLSGLLQVVGMAAVAMHPTLPSHDPAVTSCRPHPTPHSPPAPPSSAPAPPASPAAPPGAPPPSPPAGPPRQRGSAQPRPPQPPCAAPPLPLAPPASPCRQARRGGRAAGNQLQGSRCLLSTASLCP